MQLVHKISYDRLSHFPHWFILKNAFTRLITAALITF